MAKKEWKALLDKANENLQKYDVQLVIDGCDENGYSLDIKWTGKLVMTEEYACGYYEHELADLINEAWAHVLAKVNDPNLAKPVAVPVEKPKVWVVTFINDCEWEMPNVSVQVFGSLDAARKCLDEEWQTLTSETEYDEDVSKKDDDDFLFEDHCANRTIGEIKEREIRDE